jgi:hypothetical protein
MRSSSGIHYVSRSCESVISLGSVCWNCSLLLNDPRLLQTRTGRRRGYMTVRRRTTYPLRHPARSRASRNPFSLCERHLSTLLLAVHTNFRDQPLSHPCRLPLNRRLRRHLRLPQPLPPQRRLQPHRNHPSGLRLRGANHVKRPPLRLLGAGNLMHDQWHLPILELPSPL